MEDERSWTLLILFYFFHFFVFHSDSSSSSLAWARPLGLDGVAPDEAGSVGPGDRERAERHLHQEQHANPAAAPATGTTPSAAVQSVNGCWEQSASLHSSFTFYVYCYQLQSLFYGFHCAGLEFMSCTSGIKCTCLCPGEFRSCCGPRCKTKEFGESKPLKL